MYKFLLKLFQTSIIKSKLTNFLDFKVGILLIYGVQFMACYFDSCGNLIMRKGDSAKFTIESDDIPFESYSRAYFAIIDLETFQPVLPELEVETTSERSIPFNFTAQQTDSLPQPEEAFDTYGYTFKLCRDDGTEDTFIPSVEQGCDAKSVVVKKIPKVHFYPKVNEGTLPPEE